jgi:hypothetical protein
MGWQTPQKTNTNYKIRCPAHQSSKAWAQGFKLIRDKIGKAGRARIKHLVVVLFVFVMLLLCLLALHLASLRTNDRRPAQTRSALHEHVSVLRAVSGQTFSAPPLINSVEPRQPHHEGLDLICQPVDISLVLCLLHNKPFHSVTQAIYSVRQAITSDLVEDQ